MLKSRLERSISNPAPTSIQSVNGKWWTVNGNIHFQTLSLFKEGIFRGLMLLKRWKSLAHEGHISLRFTGVMEVQ